MVRVQPERLRHDLFEPELDLKRVFSRRQAGAVGNTEDVRVDRERLLPEGGIQDDVGGLAADARQLLQLLASPGYLSIMIADQRFGQSNDVLGLGVEQADRLDGVTNRIPAQPNHLLGCLDPLE